MLTDKAGCRLPLVRGEDTVRDALAAVDACGKGICLVVDGEQHLVATITDGDFRRAILAGINLDETLDVLLNMRATTSGELPVTAPVGTPDPELIHLMASRAVRHVPLLDPDKCVRDLAALDELVKKQDTPLRGLIMAGGQGTRLQPLTNQTPKPMLPVNGRPLLEHILLRLREAGIRNVSVATNYLSETITEHFKDGSELGVRIHYVHENQPLGTAGALGMLEKGTDPLLVINGDILTGVDFRAMYDFHVEHRAEMTVAVRQYDIQVPYGVVETRGVDVTGVAEKPTLRHFINAGIYLIDAAACRWVPPNQAFDMPDLISRILHEGGRVISFPIREYWLDIGQMEQYERAAQDVARGAI